MNTSTDDNKRPQAVILMGIPASGKSTFCARYFGAEKGYVRINRDTERSRGGRRGGKTKRKAYAPAFIHRRSLRSAFRPLRER